jgi:hypothetical protein
MTEFLSHPKKSCKKFKHLKQFVITTFLLLLCIFGYSQEPDTLSVWQIDSIQINKNWRTRDKIILRELQFSAGEKVDQNKLETSINQVWNIGSFAQVDYSFDTLSPNSYLLNINAKDAFNLVPYVTVGGNSSLFPKKK